MTTSKKNVLVILTQLLFGFPLTPEEFNQLAVGNTLRTPSVVTTLLFVMKFIDDNTLTRFTQNFLTPVDEPVGPHVTYLYAVFAGLFRKSRFFELVFNKTTVQDWNFDLASTKAAGYSLEDTTSQANLRGYAKHVFVQSGIYLPTEFVSKVVLERLGDATLLPSSSKAITPSHTILIDLTRTLSDVQMIYLMDYMASKTNFKNAFPSSTRSSMIFAFIQLQRSRLLVKWTQIMSIPWGTKLLPREKPTPFTLNDLRVTSNRKTLEKYVYGFNACMSGCLEIFLRDTNPKMFNIIRRVLKVSFNEATCFGEQVTTEKMANTLAPLVSASHPPLKSLTNITESVCITPLMTAALYRPVIETFLEGGSNQRTVPTSFGIDLLARLATTSEEFMYLFNQLIKPNFNRLATTSVKQITHQSDSEDEGEEGTHKDVAEGQQSPLTPFKMTFCNNLPVHLRRLHAPEENVTEVAHSIYGECIKA